MYLHNVATLHHGICGSHVVLGTVLYMFTGIIVHSCTMCENPLNTSMINMRLAKLQSYGKFRVTNRVRSQHVRITDILLHSYNASHHPNVHTHIGPTTYSILAHRSSRSFCSPSTCCARSERRSPTSFTDAGRDIVLAEIDLEYPDSPDVEAVGSPVDP